VYDILSARERECERVRESARGVRVRVRGGVREEDEGVGGYGGDGEGESERARWRDGGRQDGETEKRAREDEERGR
jgi:hypothetical protein